MRDRELPHEKLLLELQRLREENASLRMLRMREKAHETSLPLEHIFASSSAILCYLDTDRVFQAVNDTFLAAYQMEREDVVGRTAEEVFGRKRLEKYFLRQFEICLEGEELHHQAWISHPGLGKTFREISYLPHHDETGETRGVLVISRDISARAQVSAALERSSRQLEFILDNLPIVPFIARPGEVPEIEYVSPAVERVTGFPLEIFVGGFHFWLSRLHPDDRDWGGELPSEISRLRRLEREYRWQVASGEYRWFRINMQMTGSGENGDHCVFGFVHDVTEQRKAQEALEASEQRFRALYEQFPEGIVLLDGERRIRSVNPKALELLGAPFEELEGRYFRELYHPDEFKVAPPRGEAIASGVTVRIERRVKARDGYAPIDLCIKKVDADLVQVILRDLSERKRVERELTEARLQAEGANRAKGEFLANMSHEIRTPITGILGLTDMASRVAESPKCREYLGMLKGAANSLLTIVDDILDLSKIEAGKLTLAPVEFDLHEKMQEVHRLFAVLARPKGLDVSLETAPGVPRIVKGDPDRLAQVLRNLLSNAVKFTECGSVDISVGFRSGRSPDVLLFSVRDTGIGIPPDKLPLIFSSFSQADPSISRRYGGTGLGLAISRQLAEMMGGTMWVESREGEGSTFYFTASLPESCNNGDAMPSVGGDELFAVLPALDVLLVEDNAVNRVYISHFMEEAGHRVVCVEDGVEALQKLASHRFHVVLMDIQMPRMDGLEAVRRIRSDRTGAFDPKIPVIALTAHALSGDRERFLEAGMDDYVTKPVDMERLARAMARVLAAGWGRRC